MSCEGGCQSWRINNTGLAESHVNALAYDPTHPNTIYAGPDSSVYVSFDKGKTWNAINADFSGILIVYSIVVDPQSNVYIATSSGIYQLEMK